MTAATKPLDPRPDGCHQWQFRRFGGVISIECCAFCGVVSNAKNRGAQCKGPISVELRS